LETCRLIEMLQLKPIQENNTWVSGWGCRTC
jgi:hypothetical protein